MSSATPRDPPASSGSQSVGHGRTKSTDHAFGGPTAKFTQSKLFELRKKEHLPDISYDLDGDGYVGGRDYVIGRRFDEGMKNYLTADERKKAIEAVKNGYEDKFVWNVEASGAQRQFRIMQKRGQIVDSDDFQAVATTYPPHPLGEFKPALKTQTELKNHRKNSEATDIRGKVSDRAEVEAQLRKVHFKDYYIPQEFVEKPKYNAMWEK